MPRSPERELDLKPIDLICRHFSLDFRGWGLRAHNRFSETCRALCSGQLDPNAVRTHRMAVAVWGGVGFEIAAALADGDAVAALALQTWQLKFDPRYDWSLIVEAAIAVGKKQSGGKVPRKQAGEARVVVPFPRTPSASASVGGFPRPHISGGALISGARLAAPLVEDAFAALVGRPRAFLARVDAELQETEARLPSAAQRRRLARRVAAARAEARVAKRRDFSHLALGVRPPAGLRPKA